MELWIARDKDGDLAMYDVYPTENGFGCWESSGNYYKIDWRLFPEITFENSPQEIELKLVKDNYGYKQG